MPTKFKEIIIEADSLYRQNFCPDFCQTNFNFILRSDILRRHGISRYFRCGQTQTIDFAVRRQRQRRQFYEGGWHLILWNATAEEGSEFSRRNFSLRNKVSDQTLVVAGAGCLVAGNDSALTHRWMPGQLGFNFAKLDPEATQLYLLISPAREFKAASN